MPPEEKQRSRSQAGCLVRVAQGLLEGRIEAAVKVFKGIPYASPPIGPLRFRAPQAPGCWTGVRPATRFADAAPQPSDPGFFPGDPDAMPQVAMSEDCLYLNVWAPAVAGPHPVLVWLHGGSQILGGTARPVYDGTAFAGAGIVCVTVGFRLGALGYLELGSLLGADYAESGNNGLADQLAALRWVHDNIVAFGGDATRVTLGGDSAGAKNVAALMASPAAKELFRAAILQSGGAETVYDVGAAREVAARYLATTGIDAPELLAMAVPDLLAAQQRLLAGGGQRFPFRPIYGTALLPEAPLARIRRAAAGFQAVLIGTTRDEIGPMLPDNLLGADWLAELLAHLTPDEMADIERHAGRAFLGVPVTELRRQLTVAEEYWVPSIRLAEACVSAGIPTWMYRFDFALPTGPLSGSAPHNADLLPSWSAPSRYDGLVAARMHDLIVDVVRGHRVNWPAYDLPDRTTALIGETLILANHPGRPTVDLFSASP